MSDDPMVWLVEEFGGGHNGELPTITLNHDRIRIRYYYGEPLQWWLINGVPTSVPLTRDDVRRLCEIFGVEVKK